jgi:hypothetical protein
MNALAVAILSAHMELQAHQQPAPHPANRARVRRTRARLPRDLQPGGTPANLNAMEPNPLLVEIRATRDRIARECDYDLRKLLDRIRSREAQEKARGVQFVSFDSQESNVLREDPPPQ